MKYLLSRQSYNGSDYGDVSRLEPGAMLAHHHTVTGQTDVLLSWLLYDRVVVHTMWYIWICACIFVPGVWIRSSSHFDLFAEPGFLVGSWLLLLTEDKWINVMLNALRHWRALECEVKSVQDEDLVVVTLNDIFTEQPYRQLLQPVTQLVPHRFHNYHSQGLSHFLHLWLFINRVYKPPGVVFFLLARLDF